MNVWGSKTAAIRIYGPRDWIDKTINRIFWRACLYLILAVLLLLTVVTIDFLKNL